MLRIIELFFAGAMLIKLTCCGSAGSSDMEHDLPDRDVSAPIQTDTTVYVLVPDEYGWGSEIPFQFKNLAEDTVYAVNCGGELDLKLEKQEGPAWITFWGPVLSECLSAPVVISPGHSMHDTLQIWGARPGENRGPAFRRLEVEGTYRIVLQSLVFHYDEMRLGFGDSVPSGLRYSNEFRFRILPRMGAK